MYAAETKRKRDDDTIVENDTKDTTKTKKRRTGETAARVNILPLAKISSIAVTALLG